MSETNVLNQQLAAHLLEVLTEDAEKMTTSVLTFITAIESFTARQMAGLDPQPTPFGWALLVEQLRVVHAAFDERRVRLAPMLEDARRTAAALTAAEGAKPSPEPGVTVH